MQWSLVTQDTFPKRVIINDVLLRENAEVCSRLLLVLVARSHRDGIYVLVSCSVKEEDSVRKIENSMRLYQMSMVRLTTDRTSSSHLQRKSCGASPLSSARR